MSDIVLLGEVEETIANSIARTLFVSGYADFCEENDCGRRPGPGGDWSNTAGKTPAEFNLMAYRLIGAFEQMNGASLICVFASACRENSVEFKTPPQEFVTQYGHYMAMSSMGHGVSWTDDHEPHFMSDREVSYPMFDPNEHFDYERFVERNEMTL